MAIDVKSSQPTYKYFGIVNHPVGNEGVPRDDLEGDLYCIIKDVERRCIHCWVSIFSYGLTHAE